MINIAHMKCLNQFDVSVEVYPHTKNQFNTLLPSLEIGLSRILQSDYSRAFWTITIEHEFSQIWAGRSRTTNITNDKTFEKNKKALFWALFGKIWAKINFANMGSVRFEILQLLELFSKMIK